MTHGEWIQVEWEVTRLLKSMIPFCHDTAKKQFHQAAAALIAVRSAAQWLSDPATPEDIRKIVIDNMLNDLFGNKGN